MTKTIVHQNCFGPEFKWHRDDETLGQNNFDGQWFVSSNPPRNDPKLIVFKPSVLTFELIKHLLLEDSRLVVTPFCAHRWSCYVRQWQDGPEAPEFARSNYNFHNVNGRYALCNIWSWFMCPECILILRETRQSSRGHDGGHFLSNDLVVEIKN
jgi:hypothetical protein